MSKKKQTPIPDVPFDVAATRDVEIRDGIAYDKDSSTGAPPAPAQLGLRMHALTPDASRAEIEAVIAAVEGKPEPGPRPKQGNK